MTIAALADLAAHGAIRRDDTVVAFVTGMGLKTVEAFAERFVPTATIPARLEALADVVGAPV